MGGNTRCLSGTCRRPVCRRRREKAGDSPKHCRWWLAIFRDADGGQVRALLSKRIKEKESGVAREGYPGASGADAGLLPAESAAGEKKEKADPPGMPAALLVPHPTGMFSGHSPVPLTFRRWRRHFRRHQK